MLGPPTLCVNQYKQVISDDFAFAFRRALQLDVAVVDLQVNDCVHTQYRRHRYDAELEYVDDTNANAGAVDLNLK